MKRKKYGIVFLVLTVCCGILFTACKGNYDAAKVQRADRKKDISEKEYFIKLEEAAVSTKEFLAEAYFEILYKDDVFQNGKMEFSGLVIDDIDENGQMDMLIRVQDPAEEFLYGTGCIYIYVNDDEPYCFFDEELPYFGGWNVSYGDIDNDGNVEIIFEMRGTGCGGTGDWYPVILKYKEYGIERMEIPTYEEGDYAYYPSIYVAVYQEPQKDTYSAYCPYLNDTIVFHSPNFWQDAALPETTVGAGSNSRGFIDLQCVEYQGKNALQVSEYLYGEGGHVHCVAFANFIIMWDKEGNGQIADWWIDPS